MINYDLIFKYIPYFEEKNKQKAIWSNPSINRDGSYSYGYPQYDEMMIRFSEDFHQSEAHVIEYFECLKKHQLQSHDIKKLIDRSDEMTLRALLTYYVRQERFCDGLWETAMEEGIFLAILSRLKAVIK